MKVIEFKRKDGSPIYVRVDAIDHWSASTENSNYSVMGIRGKEHTLGETVDEINRKLDEQQPNATPIRRRG